MGGGMMSSTITTMQMVKIRTLLLKKTMNLKELSWKVSSIKEVMMMTTMTRCMEGPIWMILMTMMTI